MGIWYEMELEGRILFVYLFGTLIAGIVALFVAFQTAPYFFWASGIGGAYFWIRIFLYNFFDIG